MRSDFSRSWFQAALIMSFWIIFWTPVWLMPFSTSLTSLVARVRLVFTTICTTPCTARFKSTS